jgi:uncharacterized protein YjbI with pentapeptide repeats
MTPSIKLVFIVCFLLFGWNAFADEGAQDLSQATLGTQRLRVSLPEESFVALKINSSDLGGGSFSWSGKLTGGKTGFLSFAKVGNYLNGSITLTSGGGYSFRGPPGNLNFQAGFARAKSCGGCKSEQGLPPDPRSGAQPLQSWRNGDANLVDILVVYPSAVRAEAGDANTVEATIASAVADANLCYRNSLVPMQLRVVHTEEVSYTPTGQLSIDLNRLKNPSDGSMDNVHSLRDQYGADLVSLLTTTSDSGGLASTMQHPRLSFESSGFNVNVWSQLGAPSYTLAHEIGHNMACLHNREDSTWDEHYELSAFCFGKRWLQGGQGYRTVMSYDSNPASYGNRVPFFSNPNVSYLGTAAGNAGTEDNAQVLSITAPYVSNFRTSKVQAILPTVFDLQVNEGDSASFKVRLTVEPVSLVQVTASIGGDGDLFISGPTTLTFDSGNWNIGHTVQVSGQADSDSVNGSSTLTLSASGVPSSTVQLTENDSGTSLEPDFLVAGIVSNDLGMGLSGVTLTLSNAGGALQSDANGSFRSIVASGWSGTITPTKAGYAFTPSSVSVGSLGSNSVGYAFSAARSSILYVDKDAVGSGDGTSWANAFVDLSAALLSQSSFNEVWVAEGTYLPGTVRPAAFLLPPQVVVYGGFAGNEGSLSDRDVLAHPTNLSGDIGTQGVDSDNSFHVVIPSQGSTLDGFTIKAGNASKNYSDDRGKGAGLWADSSSFAIRNCIFSDNRSYQGGSGAYLKDANATFIDCVFSSNLADSTGSGGAAYMEDSNVTLQSCSFTSNSSGFAGGAMRWENSVGSMTDCNLTENQNTGSNGAGALYLLNSPLSITRCKFTRNSTSANTYGGAVKLASSSPVFTNCIFTRNSNPANSGGAIHVDPSSNPTFTGNEFRFNSSSQFGGAIFTEGNLNLSGGLFLGNYSNFGGGVASQGSVSCSFSKVRIYGNEANSSGSSSGGFAYFNTGSTGSTFVNCAISGNKSLGRNGVYKPTGATRFVNCSITGNEAVDLGGIAILFGGDSIAMDNSIIWGNSAGTANDVYVNSQTASANYSLFNPWQSSGSISSSNEINSDPLFTDANGADNTYGTEDDDLSLQASSPGVDSASASVADYSTTDLLGLARSGTPDRGAYEFIAASPPVFTSSSSFSAQENQTDVGAVTATDANGDVLAYSITGGTDQTNFSINTATGSLSFSSPPDFENPTDSDTNNLYQVIVTVSDGTHDVNETISVTVTDALESTPNNPPGGLNSTGTLSISENQPVGTVVGSFTATDPDAGAVLTYQLVSGLGDGDNSLFTLEVNGTLKSATTFDYESNASSYAIRVQAKDEFNATAEGNFTVTVLDVNESVPNNPPTGLAVVAPLTVYENRVVGELVGSFTASDPDANATLQYSLYGASPGNAYFTLDGNGTLRTGVSLDYESNTSHVIRVRVVDEHQAYAEGNFAVTVLNVNESVPNNPPTGLTHQASLAVEENASIGTVVGSFTASDPDANATLQYSLYDGNGTPGNAYFTLDLNGTLSTAAVLDYETNASHLIRIRVTDEHQAYAEGNFTVIVLDVNESVPNTPPSGLDVVAPLTVYENRVVGEVVGSFTASDPDANATLQYSLYDGNGTPGNAYFTLDLNGILSTAVVLDYETNASHLIRIRVTDEHQAYAEGNFTVTVFDVNESVPNNPPTGLAVVAPLTVYENRVVGELVGSFTASDPDANATLQYSLYGASPGNAYFTLDLNGTLSTAAVLDYETNASHMIRVRVYDEHQEYAEGNFTVIVLDLNEGAPNDYRGMDISVQDLSGQDLSTALFDHTTVFSSLVNGYRVGANLLGTDANLTGLNLQQTDFRGVNLAGVDLSNCVLTVILSSNGTNNQVSKLTALFDGTTIFSGIHPITLQRVSANLSNLVGSGATLVGPYPGTDFRGVNLAGTDLSGSDLSQSVFDHTTIFSMVNPANGQNVGANLNGSNAQLTNIAFGPADFRGTELAGVNFTRSDLSAALFDAATIFSAIDSSTNQRVGANFLATDANFSGIDLQQKDFRGVNLGGINLSNSNLSSALFDHTTVFSGIDPLTNQRVGVNLSNVTGNAAILTGPFPGANFCAVNLAGVNLSGSDLSQSSFDHTTVFSVHDVASGQNFGVNLTGSNAQLLNVPFGVTDFRGTQLAGVNFAGSDLSSALFDESIVFSALDPSTNQQVGVSLLATDANLTGLNFSQKDFRGVNLAGVNLSNANLTAAQLDHTTVFSGVDPGTLQRVGVNLSNQTGNGASLSGPFPGIEFRETNLMGVHLEGADLSSSLMDLSTVLTQSTYDQTTQWPSGIDPVARGAIYTGPNRVPVITSSSAASIPENQPLSFDVNASDPDGNTLGYVITGGSDEFKFEINASTGLLAFETNASAGMDFEVPTDANNDNVYEVTIGVSDGSELVHQNILVTITDENDVPKNFDALAALNVKENQPIGLFVGEFNASDQDAGSTLVYALASGEGDAGNGLFALEGNGTLRTAEILNYESNASRVIRVRVTDDRGASIEAVFAFNVGDANDPPANLAASAALNVMENQPVSIVVGEFVASDEDANATLTYELVSGAGDAGNGVFALEANGTLKTATVFDFESNASTYSVRVRAIDEHNASVEGMFAVNLTDLNEAPVNLVTIGGLSVAENQPIGSSVGEFAASDEDANTTLTHELVSGAGDEGNGLFALEANGTFKTATMFDFESNASTYSVRVRVKDEHNVSVEGMFAVNLLDLNEAPVNLVTTSGLSVSENQPVSTVVGEFAASDEDANTTLTYELVSGAGDEGNGLFALEANGTLKTATVFDFESNASTYSVRVRAKDEHNVSVEGAFTVNLTDLNEAPVNLVAIGGLSVGENQPIGSSVGEFNATDQDANATLTYELVSGAGDEGNGLFALEANGTLKTATVFDFENNASSYAIRVRVRDEHNVSVEDTFTVNLLDLNEVPFNLVSVGSLSVSENQPVRSFVGEFNASDYDANATLLYYMHESNVPAGNQYFTMDLNGTLRTAVSLNYESSPTHLIRIRVYDEWQGYAEGNFTVTVLDVNESGTTPAFDFNATALQVEENADIDSYVGRFTSFGGDANASVSYVLNPDAAGAHLKFFVDANGSLRTLVALDYEKSSQWTLYVTAANDVNETTTNFFTVSVLDLNEAPVNLVSVSGLTVEENQPVGSFVGEFNASDYDANATLRYSLRDGNGSTVNAYFTLDGNGTLRTAVNLDYESNASHVIRVRVYDEHQAYAEGNFTVTVLDVNESVPNVPPDNLDSNGTLVMRENEVIGSVVGSFTSVDPDANVSLQYYLYDGNGTPGNAYFTLDGNGTLRTAVSLDYESNASHVIRVRVYDEFQTYAEGNFTVVVLDVNESLPNTPPDNLDSNGTLAMRENEVLGSLVGSFTAVDPDGNGSLHYYLHDGNGTPGNAYFTLDLNGTLSTAVALDYESNASHLIRVRAYDEFQAFVEGNFTVQVLDVNESVPNTLFDVNATVLSIRENAPAGSYVGQFDYFGGEPNASVTFGLNPDTAGAYLKFEIDASGSLRTLVALDYEEASQWTLNVTAVNGFNESASRLFVLEVINLYEAPVNYRPSDLTAPGGLTVKQDDPVGSVVGTFEVVDLNDTGFHAFELVGGEGDADNTLFSLDLNGTLRNASVLSYDQNKGLSVRVRVTDSWYFSYEESFAVSYVAVEKPGESVGLISDGADLGGGWKRAGWFGYYFGAFYPWVYHENLGWLYVAQKSAEDTWLHHERLGWVWTNRHVFPHMYVFKRSHWTFLDRTTWPAKIFDYSYVEWFELGRKYRISVSMEPSVGGTISGSGDYYRWDPVRIEAIPKFGYLFNGWAGDLNGNNPVVEFEAVGDINLTGSFMPDFSSAVQTAEAIAALNELLESLDHLTPSERQSAMAEILINGKSSNAGIDLRDGDQ